tara:strand:+ start:52 stop:426 length:375 start_codon:yes stop_codon:yes gene_type:complete
MMSEEYNGWTNRQTWIINVHEFFDYDYIEEVIKEQIIPDIAKRPMFKDDGQFQMVARNLLAQWMENNFNLYVEESLHTIEEAPLNFLFDLIRSIDIDWQQLASHYEELIEEYYQMDLRGVVATQ